MSGNSYEEMDTESTAPGDLQSLLNRVGPMKPMAASAFEITDAYNEHIKKFLSKESVDDLWNIDASVCKEDCGQDSDCFKSLASKGESIPSNEWCNLFTSEMSMAEKKSYFHLENAWNPSMFSNYQDSLQDKEFQRRLVVIHLNALCCILNQDNGEDKDEGEGNLILSCFDMTSLVDNFSHLFKYVECIRTAKCVYKNCNANKHSLHDQYKAKLLNSQFAHHHQDESDSILAISQRMIRQAHVANFRNRQGVMNKDYLRHFSKLDESNPERVEDVEYDLKAEDHYTNPPMAPIMCVAPPSMKKYRDALSLLMVSFALKLGGCVEFGTSSKEDLTGDKRRVENLLKRLKCDPKRVRVYSQSDSDDVGDMNTRVNKCADNVGEWTFHVRKNTEQVVNQTPNLQDELKESFPNFYGLTMCVSSTTLPILSHVQISGSTDSICCHSREFSKKDNSQFRSYLENSVILQPWSFPIAPDFLVPHKCDLTLADKGDNNSLTMWYRDYYDQSNCKKKSGEPDNRGYYCGSVDHLTEWSWNKEENAKHLHIDRDFNRPILNGEFKTFWDTLNSNKYKFSQKQKDVIVNAYLSYIQTCNSNIGKHIDPVLKKWCYDDETTRKIVSVPIRNLNYDAVCAIKQAQDWLRTGEYTTDGLVDVYPMLIMALESANCSKLESIDWAMQLCKLSWLRMHNDHKINPAGFILKDGKQIEKEYGVTVIIYISDGDVSWFKNVVCKEEDLKKEKTGKLASIVFNPTLAENRFADQEFQGSSKGVMHRSSTLPDVDWKEFFSTTTEESEPPKELNEICKEFFENTSKKDRKMYQFDDEVLHSHKMGNDFKADVVDLNGILPRLCVQTFHTVQNAVESVRKDLNISKFALVGRDILQIETPLYANGIERESEILFVPCFMSLTNDGTGKDLCKLYQAVGRGFSHLKGFGQPHPEFRLNLLSGKNALHFVRMYGEAELIAGMVHNESIEGRKMTLGSLLWTADKENFNDDFEKLPNGNKVEKYTNVNLNTAGGTTIKKMLFRSDCTEERNAAMPDINVKFQRIFGAARARLTILVDNAKSVDDFKDQDEVFKNDIYQSSTGGKFSLKRFDVRDKPPTADQRATRDDIRSTCNDAENVEPHLVTDTNVYVFGDEVAEDVDDYYDIPYHWRFPNTEDALKTLKETVQKWINKNAKPEEPASFWKMINNRRLSELSIENTSEAVVSEYGMLFDYFDWYTLALCDEEKMTRQTTGISKHLVTFDLPKPSTKLEYGNDDVTAYLQDVKTKHKDYLNSTKSSRILGVLGLVKNNLLDKKFGKASCTDTSWIRFRAKISSEQKIKEPDISVSRKKLA